MQKRQNKSSVYRRSGYKKQKSIKGAKVNSRQIQREGLLSGTPLVRQPSSKESYIDIAIGAGITNTFVPTKALDPLLGAGGLLRTFPQLCRVAAGGSANTPKWFKNITVQAIEFNLNFSGSQSNTLIPADLYNRLRFVVWSTKYPYSATTNAVWDIDSLIDWTRAEELIFDQTISLSSQAFDTSNYNSPATQNLRAMLPYRHRYNCKSTTTAGGLPTAFDTDEDNLLFGFVSDSAVAPNPAVSGSFRLYYREDDQ
jgi:hypothetical protein